MTAPWPQVPLGEVLTQRKQFVTIDDLATYKRPRVKLHAQGIVLRDEVEGSLIKTKSQQVCRAGEFLVAEIDAKVGGFGIVPAELEGAIVSSHYFLFDGSDHKLDRRFLDWYSKTPAFQEQVAAQGSTNYAAIRPDHVLAYTIPLPPLPEQRRIVARIEELAGKVEEGRAVRQRLGVDTNTLHAKVLAHAFLPYLDMAATIGQAFEVTTGGTPSRGNPAYWNGGNRWVSSGEVRFTRISDTAEKITDLGVAESNAKVYPPDTVLLAMIGQGKTRGQCAILDCHAATNQNVAGIHVYKTPHVPAFVFWWLYSRYQESRAVETGTAQPALNAQRVRDIMLPLPAPEEQLRVVAELDALQAKVDELKRLQAETQAELDALLPSILDRAFRGEL